MMMEKIERRKRTEANKRLTRAYDKMQGLIEALSKKDIPAKELTSINEHIVLLNSFDGSDKELIKFLKNTYKTILALLEEKLGFVTKHHFRALWMVYGMLAAVVFSSVFSSFEIMGIGSSASMGLSLGMLIGIVIGEYFDKQAKKEGRQIEITITGY